MKRELIKGTTSGQADWRRRQTCLITILNSLITFTFLQKHFYLLAKTLLLSCNKYQTFSFLLKCAFEYFPDWPYLWSGNLFLVERRAFREYRSKAQSGAKRESNEMSILRHKSDETVWKAKLFNTCSLTIMVGATNLIFLCWSAPVHHQSITCTGITKHSRWDLFCLPWFGIYSRMAIFPLDLCRRWLFKRPHYIQDPFFSGDSENDEQHVIWGDTFSSQEINFVSEARTVKTQR